MGLLDGVLNWMRKAWNMINKKDVESALELRTLVSDNMSDAIAEWNDIFTGNPRWLKTNDRTLNLGASVAGTISRIATSEMTYDLSGSARADWLSEQLSPVIDNIQNSLEIGNALGTLVFKPRVADGEIQVDVVGADAIFPVAYTAAGRVTGIIFADRRKIDKWYYTRLEHHDWKPTGELTVTNAAYRSDSADKLGRRVELSSVDDWKKLQEIVPLENIRAPLYGLYRYPSVNYIDRNSPLGMSCFARAQNGGSQLLQSADEIYNNLLWEMESGRRAIYVDEAAFEIDPATKQRKLPDKRLYVAIKAIGALGEKNQLIQEFSPAFREQQIRDALNGIKREIEFACGLAYGTISDPQVEARTATEVATSQQRTYVTITNVQAALETALYQLVEAIDIYADIYSLAPRGNYSFDVLYDDSLITDKDAERQINTEAVNLGAAGVVEWRMRTFGEDEATATEAIAKIQAQGGARTLEDLFGGA